MVGRVQLAVTLAGLVLVIGLALLANTSGSGRRAVLMGVSGAREKAQADQSMVGVTPAMCALLLSPTATVTALTALSLLPAVFGRFHACQGGQAGRGCPDAAGG